MSIKARGDIAVTSITDVASATRYYLLQASTLAAPSKPTTSAPGGSWVTTEPTYAEGSTNSLYTVDRTVFSDGTFAYSDVSLSSSYEASKTAYNKAVAALAAANNVAACIENTTAGVLVGHKVSGAWSGYRALVNAAGSFDILDSDGATIASFSASAIELGKNLTSSVIKLCQDTFEITKTAGYSLISTENSSFRLRCLDGGTISIGTYSETLGDSDYGIGLSNGNAIFNAESFQFNGTSMTDFIVASGTSGNWRYIKFNSGLALCTAIITVAQTASNWCGASLSLPFTMWGNSAHTLPPEAVTGRGNDAATWSFAGQFYMDRLTTGVGVTNYQGAAASIQYPVFVFGWWK